MSRFRVLQFNMQFGQLWDAGDADRVTIDLAATLAEIRRHDADVILLQEVEHAQPGGLQLQPPPNFTWLRAELPDYQSCFAYPKADPRELPFGLGLAIFSRGPIRDVIQLDLPSPPIEFDFYGNKTTPTDRLLIGAKVMLHGRELQCFNTHLLALFMLGDGKTDSPWQRNLVADQISEATGPALLTGDFNEQRSEILIDFSAATVSRRRNPLNQRGAVASWCSIIFFTTPRSGLSGAKSSRHRRATIMRSSRTSSLLTEAAARHLRFALFRAAHALFFRLTFLF